MRVKIAVRRGLWSTQFARVVVILTALLAAACGSSSAVSTNPSPLKCAVTVSAPSGAMDPKGGAGTLGLTTAAECAWTAASQVSWIGGVTPASGQGNAQLQFQISPNPDPSPRQGDIVINDQHAQIQQNGTPCAFQVTPQTQTIGANEATGSIAVVTAATCTWTATAGASWLSITAGATGTGNGTVTYRAQANAGDARAGAITIGGQTVTIAQSSLSSPPPPSPPGGQPGCEYAIDASVRSIGTAGGPLTVGVTAGAGCAWTAESQIAWVAVTNGASGSGNGTVSLTVAANGGPSRIGPVRIAGLIFLVDQAGNCAVAISPASQSFSAAGGAGSGITVTTNGGCAWTAMSGVPWIAITNGASGSGNGAVAFTVAANPGAARTGAIAIAGQAFTVTQAAAPAPPNCAASLNPASQSVPVGGGAGAPIAVTIADGCAWTATSNAPWITITNGASGSGNGSVSFSVGANSGGARSGTIAVAGQTFTVNQAGSCAATINPTSQSAPVGGNAGNQVAVTAAAGCAWTATSNATWLTITNGASGNGNGTVTFTVAANSGAARSGTIAIAGQTFTVDQAGSCAATINPTSQSIAVGGGAGNQVAVTIAAGCAWTATSNATWLTITNGASGNGPGTVTFTAAANSGAERSGTIAIAGQTFTANQAANQAASCAATLNPTSQSIPVGGGAGNQVAVTIAAGCAWTATSNATWLTITNGASGNGPGTVTFTAAANTGGARSGTIAIAGQTFTANQAASCAATLNPTSQSIPVGGGAGNQVAVTIAAGCAWTATSNATWLTITNGASGNGPGTVTFTAAANSGGARSGTLTIAGQTFTANQAPNCAPSINPTSQSSPIAGGTGNQVAVTVAAGCGWTATSNASWLTITNGASGNGPGTVTYTVAANAGANRSGTLTVAGLMLTVNQSGPCNPSLAQTGQNFNRNAANGDVDVNNGGSCAWTAVSQVSWIQITSGSPDTGNGKVRYHVDAFSGPGTSRSGTIIIAGLTFTVTQSSQEP